MPCSTRYVNWNNTFCALILLSQPIAGTGFVPRDIAAGEAIARRTSCDPAAPDVSESSIIAHVCNQTLANASSCSDQMTMYMQQSATSTCGQYVVLFTDCLMANNDDHTACSDSLLGYQDCNNYTMQAYAYCGCYCTRLASLADCANEQLRSQPQGTAMVSTTSARVTAISTGSDMTASGMVHGAASADKEPMPAVPTVSGGAAFPSNQSTFSFSNPRIPIASTVRITSLKWATPYRDLGTAWTPSSAPSTSTAPVTVVVTYTTTFTAAGYTTTATVTPASISTVYTCADGGDATSAASVSAAAAAGPTSIVPAAIGPETSAPHSAAVAAQSTETRRAEGTTSPIQPSAPPSAVVAAQSTGARSAEGAPSPTQPFAPPPPPSTAWPARSTRAESAPGTPSRLGDPDMPPSPSAAALALSTGVAGLSEAPAGRNGCAVCARCRRRRRSKIF